MAIQLGTSYAVSEIGHRQNNEDAVFPVIGTNTANSKLFIVCDGVGGSEKGEVASSLACRCFNQFFNQFLKKEPSKSFINEAVQFTEKHFDNYVISVPEAEGMATTLAMVYLSDNHVTVAHIGDSRIYQIRKGRIIFRTQDHSLVNSLVRLGKITEEEARVHPQKNIILRALQGSVYPVEAEVSILSDIQTGDYLFLCSDGVLEGINDKELALLFEGNEQPERIYQQIKSICQKKSRDNFSFYLLPIEEGGTHPSRFKQNIQSFLSSLLQMV